MSWVQQLGRIFHAPSVREKENGSPAALVWEDSACCLEELTALPHLRTHPPLLAPCCLPSFTGTTLIAIWKLHSSHWGARVAFVSEHAVQPSPLPLWPSFLHRCNLDPWGYWPVESLCGALEAVRLWDHLAAAALAHQQRRQPHAGE
jgi:hypothetical protein